MPSDQTAERALPDEAVEAAVRVLMRCPDVPEHAHVSMLLLTSMADDLGGDWRAALEVAYAAGRASVLDNLTPMWGARNPDGTVMPLASEDDARDYAQPSWVSSYLDHPALDVVECRRTEWQAVDGAGQ